MMDLCQGVSTGALSITCGMNRVSPLRVIAHGKCKLILHRNGIGLFMLSNATCSLNNVQTLTNLNLHPESGQVRTHLPVMIGREQRVS